MREGNLTHASVLPYQMVNYAIDLQYIAPTFLNQYGMARVHFDLCLLIVPEGLSNYRNILTLFSCVKKSFQNYYRIFLGHSVFMMSHLLFLH